jgi:hypothetical protein
VEPCDDCKLRDDNEKPCLKTYKNGKGKRDKITFTTAPTSPIQNETQTAPRVSEPSPNCAQNVALNHAMFEPSPIIVENIP